MRQDAIDAINAVKPYKGGNDTLWILHKLNNIDKHRFVIIVGSALRSVDLGGYMFRKFQSMTKHIPAFSKMEPVHAFYGSSDKMFPLKQGDELFIDGPGAEADEKMQFRFEVAFGEPRIIEGQPLIETLQSMIDLIDHLVTDFGPLLV
jgi:hypothetical protein